MVPVMYILHYGYRNPYPTRNIAGKYCCMEIACRVVGSQLTDWAFCPRGDDSTGVAGWWHKPSGLTVINLENIMLPQLYAVNAIYGCKTTGIKRLTNTNYLQLDLRWDS